IKSAVVSFEIGDVRVNLIDTPGHPDFIAEVERVLGVLDGAVLVISAVEGVQSQTRRLARAIRAANLPLLIFVNKIDRIGARSEQLLDDVQRKLKLRVVPMTTVDGIGDRDATATPCDRRSPAWRESVIDRLAETSERVIEEFDRSGGKLDNCFLDAELRAQVAAGEIVPAFFGSAITGVGVPELLAGVEEWLPPATVSTDVPPGGTVFKIERRRSGEKIVYARLFAGRLFPRDHVEIHRQHAYAEPERIEERITGIDCFASGGSVPATEASSGDIVGLHGLRAARIGDWFGTDEARARDSGYAFPAPALESVVQPVDPGQITRLRTALEYLAEQDPLISLRQRNDAGELSVRLYGEVQKEVIADMLSREFGLEATFGPSQTICIERPIGSGDSLETIGQDGNPFFATVGFRVEPAVPGTGIRFVRDLGMMPLAFYRAVEETVHETLRQGLCGWEVIDCAVTLTQCGIVPESAAADFRRLAPLVLVSALASAGTEVCEPVEELELEVPEDTSGAVCGALINARATIRTVIPDSESHHITCQIPVAELRSLEQRLPGLTRGDGVWVSSFGGYVAVTSEVPLRMRVGPNPLNRAHYLAEVARS
ncbi:MAG TPA: translation factor GTPase family protein, partial [Thermomicrobiales bacterium]|nr:translation factor GTPase family protein [Thermomicrobiales bacterium]